MIQPMAVDGFPASECCGARSARVYSPPADPYGESAFKSFYTDQLTHGDHPEMIKSRKDWKDKMDAMGVMPKEKGMDYRAEVARINREKERKKQDAQFEVNRIRYSMGLPPEGDRR